VRVQEVLVKARRWRVLGLGAALLLAAVGSCGDSGGGGGCSELAGTWTIQQHCAPQLIGVSVPIVETGTCAYVTQGTFAGYAIAVATDGTVSVSGGSADTPVTCSGTATASRLDVDCMPTCHVVVTR
jgi:hypothetical protein